MRYPFPLAWNWGTDVLYGAAWRLRAYNRAWEYHPAYRALS